MDDEWLRKRAFIGEGGGHYMYNSQRLRQLSVIAGTTGASNPLITVTPNKERKQKPGMVPKKKMGIGQLGIRPRGVSIP